MIGDSEPVAAVNMAEAMIRADGRMEVRRPDLPLELRVFMAGLKFEQWIQLISPKIMGRVRRDF